MNETKHTVAEFAQSAAAWIGICGAIFAVLTFCMQLGMWYGPMKELPAQYNIILAKLNQMEGRINKADWDMDSIKARIKERDEENFSEHTRIWAEVLRHGGLLNDIEVIKTRHSFMEEQFKFMSIDDRAQWEAIREIERKEKIK